MLHFEATSVLRTVSITGGKIKVNIFREWVTSSGPHQRRWSWSSRAVGVGQTVTQHSGLSERCGEMWLQRAQR